MTCKLSGLFSIGEDFDDEDLLGSDWPARTASVPEGVAAAAAVSSCTLRASSAGAARREPEDNRPRQPASRSAAPGDGTASSSSSSSSTCTAAGPPVAVGLRQLLPSSSSNQPPTLPHLAPLHSDANTGGSLKASAPQDDFDDWDIDLADLDECEVQVRQQQQQQLQPPAPAPPAPAPTARTLRPPTCGGVHTLPERTPVAQHHLRGSSNHSLPPRPPAPPQSPGVFPGFTAASPARSPASVSRTLIRPQQPQRQWAATPGPSPQGRGLFETVTPSPSPSPSALSPHPLHTPVLTNRLVQLVSASNKLPKKRLRSEPHRPRTRRFPGPAGLLPQQPQDQSLDHIVVSVPHTPAHGAVARLPSQTSSSQSEDDEFGGGGGGGGGGGSGVSAWAAMKAEMGLDERNPSCFLHSYSVVMVLRKAALKQLARNKVPNMAVLLKSIIHTHTDAKAVFKDPTGEIQGTVHRQLLEDRAEELKVGAVLLLKQVGVFSPSHRNHYLNVTPNNLLRIYAPDGVALSSTQLPSLLLEPPSSSSSPARPVSQMRLVFEEEEEEDGEAGAVGSSSRGPQEPTAQDAGWDADDDLDELLGQIPEDTYSL